MNDEDIQKQILELLRTKYKPNEFWGMSSDEISKVLDLSHDDILTNLHYMEEKNWISLDDSNYEFEIYLELKGFDELNRRNRKQNQLDETKFNSNIYKENPKDVLSFYQKEIKKFVDTREYYLVVVTVDKLYVYLNRLSLDKADRYHLIRTLELLSKQSKSLNITNLRSKPDKKYRDKQHEKYILKAFNDVSNYLESIIRNPLPLKHLTKPIKTKKSFLSGFKNMFNSKKYLEIKKTPDPFYEQLVNDINKAYSVGADQAILILLRKLFESAIKDLIWKKFKDESFFKTSKGGRKHFNEILVDLRKKIQENKFGHFDEELLEVLIFVDSIREEGNQSAHSLTFSKSKKEIENMKENAKKSLEILFRIINLI